MQEMGKFWRMGKSVLLGCRFQASHELKNEVVDDKIVAAGEVRCEGIVEKYVY